MKISVVLTTYNGKSYIWELLESIARQSAKADEVVIIDDVSTDGTEKIIKKFIKENELDWKVYINDTNIGWRKNFRIALRRASGDLVFLCDQDDMWEREKIELMKNVMESHKKIKLLASNYSVINEGAYELSYRFRIDPSCWVDNGTISKFDSIKCITNVLRPGCTYCVRKDLIHMMDIYDDDDLGHDNVLWHLAYASSSLYLLNRKLIKYRLHKGHTSEYNEKRTKKRRTDEIEGAIRVGKFLKNVCVNEGYGTLENVECMIEFQKKRKYLIEKGSIGELLKFQLENRKLYFRITSIVMDIYSKKIEKLLL